MICFISFDPVPKTGASPDHDRLPTPQTHRDGRVVRDEEDLLEREDGLFAHHEDLLGWSFVRLDHHLQLPSKVENRRPSCLLKQGQRSSQTDTNSSCFMNKQLLKPYNLFGRGRTSREDGSCSDKFIKSRHGSTCAHEPSHEPYAALPCHTNTRLRTGPKKRMNDYECV